MRFQQRGFTNPTQENHHLRRNRRRPLQGRAKSAVGFSIPSLCPPRPPAPHEFEAVIQWLGRFHHGRQHIVPPPGQSHGLKPDQKCVGLAHGFVARHALSRLFGGPQPQEPPHGHQPLCGRLRAQAGSHPGQHLRPHRGIQAHRRLLRQQALPRGRLRMVPQPFGPDPQLRFFRQPQLQTGRQRLRPMAVRPSHQLAQ